jgi:hypothetical protein
MGFLHRSTEICRRTDGFLTFGPMLVLVRSRNPKPNSPLLLSRKEEGPRPARSATAARTSSSRRYEDRWRRLRRMPGSLRRYLSSSARAFSSSPSAPSPSVRVAAPQRPRPRATRGCARSCLTCARGRPVAVREPVPPAAAAMDVFICAASKSC